MVIGGVFGLIGGGVGVIVVGKVVGKVVIEVMVLMLVKIGFEGVVKVIIINVGKSVVGVVIIGSLVLFV